MAGIKGNRYTLNAGYFKEHYESGVKRKDKRMCNNCVHGYHFKTEKDSRQCEYPDECPCCCNDSNFKLSPITTDTIKSLNNNRFLYEQINNIPHTIDYDGHTVVDKKVMVGEQWGQ